ncbi:MAG TPA: AmmeMemoRadiSam system protein A [Pyrinomonadaceae bacterium]|nr:AmmeMemoRadiSam system protein A [Pyrinomonadaceae bacterium]
METVGSIVFSGIAPHPPIMVPEVGGEAIVDVQGSIAAMGELTRRLIASGAETLVLISPHAPLDATAFVAYKAPILHGDFKKFRARGTTVEAPLDEPLLSAIAEEAKALDYEVLNLGPYELDHGTAVPLYFLLRNGWQGNVVALGYSFLTNEDHLRFGACINRAAAKIGRPIGFIASGDLSHRLKPEAPAGYNPKAYLFDDEVVAALRENAPQRIAEIDPELRKLAGECGYRSMLVVLGATQHLPSSCDVLNYEAPFGVGYLVAQITNATDEDSEDLAEQVKELTGLARAAVETFVSEGSQLKPIEAPQGLLAARAGCFVSLKTLAGDLRGCIGTIEPQRDSLRDEIIANAISAATRDPRFSPVTVNELSQMKYSVDVLGAPEPATMAELDPVQYGVIVEDERGDRRGLLLPDIEGVDTVARQVEIATRKAGIRSGESVKLFRFRVDRFREE